MRICYACGSNTTFINKHGNPDWATNKPTNLFLCHKCLHRYITNPKWNTIHNPKYYKLYKPRRFRFKDKRIIAKEPVRNGICQNCGKVGGKTDIHHIIYHDDDPLKDIIELCASCHGIQTYYETSSFS